MEITIVNDGLVCKIDNTGFTFYDEATGDFVYLMNDYAKKQLMKRNGGETNG